MIGYRIGTYAGGVGGLVYLEDIIDVIPYPTPFNLWSTTYPVGNGQSYGDGFPTCEWRFKWMTMTDMAVMLGYIGASTQSAQVSLSTKDDLDVFYNYSAYMHRPTYPREGDRRPGKAWSNVVFKFTQLEIIT